MKKSSIMVKQVLISIATTAVFSLSLGFTACSADDDYLGNGMAPATDQEYDGPILEAVGLSFHDFITEDDVQILNGDSTEISVSKEKFYDEAASRAEQNRTTQLTPRF